MYIRADIHVDNSIFTHLNKSNEDIELQCVVIRPPLQKRIILLTIYRPPTGNFQSFLESMHGALESVTLQDNLEIFIMGDFYIDLIEPLNQTASILLDVFQGLGFSQKNSDPTRHAKNNCSSLIDHIYTNSQCISDYGIVTMNVSDHDLVYIIRKNQSPRISN